MWTDFWQAAERVVAVDTSAAQGNTGLLPVISPLAEGLALQTFASEHLGKPQFNYLMRLGPDIPGGLLLVTHLDTVPPGPLERWTATPPFTLKREGGKVFGLGVADVSLDFLCKLFALRSLRGRVLKEPVRLLGTFSEEVGLIGAKHFAEHHLAQLRPRYVLCGEPSELIPCPAHKGYAVVEVSATSDTRLVGPAVEQTFAGKAAHSSTPHLGVNAIEQMWGAIGSQRVFSVCGGTSNNTVPAEAKAWVAATEGEKREGFDLTKSLLLLREAWQEWRRLSAALQPSTAPDFSPSEVVNNLGLIRTEGATVTATFDARLLPEHVPGDLLQAFNLWAEQRGLVVRILRDNAGMRARADSPLLLELSLVLRDLGRDGTPKPKPTSTEAGVFARHGYDAAVFGPGVSVGNAHTANEWNSESDLQLAFEVYQRLILKLCAAA